MPEEKKRREEGGQGGQQGGQPGGQQGGQPGQEFGRETGADIPAGIRRPGQEGLGGEETLGGGGQTEEQRNM